MIYTYISDRLNSRPAADSLADDVWDMVFSLNTFPNRFQKWNGNVRKVSVGKYNIYYSVDEQLHMVNILHILYQGMKDHKML